MIHYKNLVLLIYLILMVACQPEMQPSSNQNLYFDIRQYIQQEIDVLNKQQTGLTKLMHHSTSTDTLFIAQPSWKKELQIFTSVNINKPALYETYTVDTINNQIIYKSKVSKNLVKYMNLTYNTTNLKTLKMIEVESGNQNFLNSAQQTLIYESGKNYLINIQQDVIGSDGNALVIEGVIK